MAQSAWVWPCQIATRNTPARCTIMSDTARRSMLDSSARWSKNIVAVGLVIGLPIHLSGDESEKSREARLFANWLGTTTGLPFTFQDERFTSFQAEKLLMAAELSPKKRKERRDKLAAQILLQTFLDARMAMKQAPAGESCPRESS
jgi:putative Holliday junction resolvase